MQKISLMLLYCLMYMAGQAQWASQTSINNPVSVANGIQDNVQTVSDGSNGAIIAWVDTRNGNADIFIQKLNSTGQAQWAANGIAVIAAANNQDVFKLMSDGSGGAFIAWQTPGANAQADIYAQHINTSGTLLWGSNGKAVCTDIDAQLITGIVRFGTGGMLITWTDYRGSGIISDIYAQYLNANGDAQWANNGLAICNNIDDQFSPCIAVDASGSAVICWLDARNGDLDIYGQRILTNGTTQWTANGILLSPTAGTADEPQLVADGAGNVILVWTDDRTVDRDVFAQKISSTGSLLWAASGVPVCDTLGIQNLPVVVSDNAGGVIVAWQDARFGASGSNVYAQKLSSAGVIQWTVYGYPICTVNTDQVNISIASDGLNGAIITWTDPRNGSSDIYAQKITGAGSVSWQTNGTIICNAAQTQEFPAIVASGTGDAIIAWTDQRNDGGDVYASKIYNGGTLPVSWLNIEGSAVKSTNHLRWTLANETGNDHFVVERYNEGLFSAIGNVKAVGNSNQPTSYSFIDKLPRGDDLYRIKQVNKDGSFTYSKEVRIKNSNPVTFRFNNPASSTIQLQTSYRGELRFIDANGKITRKQFINATITNISTAGIRPGVYTLEMNGQAKLITIL